MLLMEGVCVCVCACTCMCVRFKGFSEEKKLLGESEPVIYSVYGKMIKKSYKPQTLFYGSPVLFFLFILWVTSPFLFVYFMGHQSFSFCLFTLLTLFHLL